MSRLNVNTTPFYIKGLEHPWILLSEQGPGTKLTWIKRDDCT